MKLLFALLLTCCMCNGLAQVKLSDKDFNNLIALSKLYPRDNFAAFTDTANSLRTPALNHVIDVLIQEAKGDSSILQKKYLSRPDNSELTLWFTIRGLRYNGIDKGTKRPEADLAKELLGSAVDERWMLDYYYHHLYEAVATLFNVADLSHYNFDMNDLGLKNDTEKAIFFYNMMAGLANGRFRVLQYLKKPEKLAAFIKKMPLFNGSPYFYYANLDIPDFEFVGYDKKESYQQRNINDLINTLYIQFSYYASNGDNTAAREVYFKSILSKPEYFKYSNSKDQLQAMYDKSKQ